MAEPKDKSLLDKAEDYVSDSYDEQRKQIPPWDDVGRVKHDVEVGIMKGVYGGAKSLISGAIDLLRLAVDPVAQQQFTQKAWPVAVKLAKEARIAYFGTPEEIRDQSERSLAFAKEVYKGFEDDWKKASGTDGKRTELAAKWVSRVGFEVGALAIGAGEAKAAVKGAEIAGDLEKLEEGAAILEEVTQTCKTVKLTRAELEAEWAAKEAAEAAEAAKAAAAAKAADAAKAAEMRAPKEPPAPKPVEPPAPKGPRPQPKGRLRQEKMYDEGHSMATWSGDQKSVVKIIRQGDDVVLDHIVRGPLQPKGSAPSMLADAIRASGNPKPSRILVPNIMQKAPASDAILESVARGAAEELGGKVTKVTRGVDSGGKHFVNLEIGY